MRNASSWPYIVRKHRSCAPFSDGGYGSRTIGTTWCRRPSPGWQHHDRPPPGAIRSEEHTSELQSLMRISYAVFCLKKKNMKQTQQVQQTTSESHDKSYTQSSNT